MRRFNHSVFALIIPAFIMLGCGGSDLVENKTLGKFPSVFVELANEQNKIREDMRSDAENGKHPGKLHEKYTKLEKEVQEKALKRANTELEKIIERTVPFEVANESPDFEIRSAMIENGSAETGALSIAVVIGAKRDLVASMNSAINYHIISTKGEILFAGTLNPFATIQIVTYSTFPHGLKVTAGDVCTDQGSLLMLYCGSYDFTDFEKIVFM